MTTRTAFIVEYRSDIDNLILVQWKDKDGNPIWVCGRFLDYEYLDADVGIIDGHIEFPSTGTTPFLALRNMESKIEDEKQWEMSHDDTTAGT
mgnify:CR=1 FL=1